MKNMYGVIPGIVYGWPKNVLHYAGIPQSVYDINASLPRTIAIVDGILCMEGDGPIMGTAKPMGLVLVGPNAPAVDATVARLMNLRPENVSYLALAAGRLGPIDDAHIEQRGEAWQPLAQPFKILNAPHLRDLPLDPGVLISRNLSRRIGNGVNSSAQHERYIRHCRVGTGQTGGCRAVEPFPNFHPQFCIRHRVAVLRRIVGCDCLADADGSRVRGRRFGSDALADADVLFPPVGSRRVVRLEPRFIRRILFDRRRSGGHVPSACIGCCIGWCRCRRRSIWSACSATRSCWRACTCFCGAGGCAARLRCLAR